MKNSRVATVIWYLVVGMLCAILFELVWFYSMPMPLWLSKKIIIRYCMNMPQAQLIRDGKKYPIEDY